MARKRRNQGITLNFDGLTDAVTNLTGTLILLVVLLLGLTNLARPSGEGAKSLDPLLQHVQALELETRLIDQETAKLEGSLLPDLKRRVEELREKSNSGSAVNDRIEHRTNLMPDGSDSSRARLLVVSSQFLPGGEP